MVVGIADVDFDVISLLVKEGGNTVRFIEAGLEGGAIS